MNPRIILSKYYCAVCLTVTWHATNTETGTIRHDISLQTAQAKLAEAGWYYGGHIKGDFVYMRRNWTYCKPRPDPEILPNHPNTERL